VYPSGATPLTVATRMGNITMVKYLIERGASITLTEKDGQRPYTIALGMKNKKLANYLKALEPIKLHSIENKRCALQKFKLPQELLDFLTGDQLHLKL
ncbi:ankyrin repeat domain-containing protein, partial [Lysinibacillus fusiformis]|uniref:ankyrin repeat domain-containing protein n=1 Tax=Lysinibacillus fusiformis TaxID=28031 RepID=UPI0020C022A0